MNRQPAYVIGIDPGLTGALAVLNCRDSIIVGALNFYPIKRGNGNVLCADPILQYLERWKNWYITVVLENVHAMPKQGVSSTATFMRAAGLIEGLLIGQRMPYMMVTPRAWKKANGIASGATKDASRELAMRLWPDSAYLFTQKKKGQAVADAALMARALSFSLPVKSDGETHSTKE